MQKLMVSGQLVQKTEWKLMDGWMEAIALPNLPMWSVNMQIADYTQPLRYLLDVAEVVMLQKYSQGGNRNCN